MRIILPEETWMPILPKISHDKLIQTEDGKMALDLAQLLADCQFAQLFYETEKECGGTHLNIRNTSVSAETDSIKNVDTAVARQVPGRVGSGSDLCVTEGTSSNHNKLLDSDHRVRAGNIEGFDQCDSDVKYSSSILTYDPQSLHTRIDTEEKFKLNYSNNSGHSSFTEVTNPLFKRLSAKHTTLAGDEVLSSLRTNPESHSLILRKKESIELLKNEVCTVLEVQKQFKPDLSIDDKENLDCEQAVEYKDGKEAPLPERFEVCVSAKDVPLSSLRHRFSNIPCWASRSLVGVMHHPVNAKNEQNIYKKNSLEFDEQPPFKAGSTPSSRRSEIRKEILKASIQPKNTEPQNAAISIEETKPACDAFFMVNSCDTLTKYCTCDLDEIYKNVIKQDSLHSTTNIVKICRVFMAGESPVLEEEVMTSKVIMSATLNPHILSVLSERGMNATRLQAYTWPSINRGCSAVIVGEKLSGKTMGFVVPLLSLILDTYEHMSRRLSPGIGPVVVVVCSSWQSAKCAAEYVVSLLPANSTLKVMTAWGGCGTEEEISTGKQLLGGCDVLLTTAPCLMRLLTGESTVWSRGGGTEGATTSLRRCCHLVFDDADVVLEHFSLEVKEIITMWGNERKACGRADLQLQVVVVSSRWTKLLGQLTDVLLPLLDPTVIISTPFEAAIAAKVKNHCHWVDDETESLSLVMNFIAAASSQKSLVFVKDDDVAALLNSMMKNIAVYCLVVDSMIHKSRLKECIDEWHVMQGITMIVSEPAEKGLLQCDISDAQAIFHTHVGLSWNTFALSLCDQARDVPQTGKVTIEVVSVVNASRYFVRLTEYQTKSDGQRIDLSNHYHILRSALQQHYADPAHCKPVQVARKGMLCALQDKSVWSRGQVVSVNYSKATCQVNVFLIDEGREMIIELSSACVLPPYFASVPKLIVEVFLCCIQPKDNDREWTSQANSFVEEIFARNKKSKFVGTIVLALGYTLWLNPLVELSTIGNICARKKSLRGKLLTERYGMDNPNHIKNLEQLCMMAGVSMRDEDTLSLCWIEARNEALQILSTVINREGLNSNILTNGKMETGETANENKEVCSNSVVHHKDSVNMTLLANVAKDHLPSASPGKTEAWPDLSYNRLPLNTEVTVEVTELVSAKEFYVVQQDKLQELDNLEDEINKLHDYLESCEGERQSGGGIVAAKPAIDSLCIAKFTDNKYYRGKVKAAESDGIVSVFFVDHGETIKVPQQQVRNIVASYSYT
ncbi:putative ATP-dependent RNA helicase TDRD12 [Portunus trituberculatus]|uniref:RNA helicase n=1 Tax=Portunus trituberculatus TaxID=210409 RepID=A0A5B7FYX8_PORTR|nr:putative ATP-dependent RNA helicase TDRD12 [Portunus trituberculatus]